MKVIDSTDTPDGVAATRLVAAEVARTWGMSVEVADLRARAAFAERLAKAAGLPPSLLRFALGDSHGCGRDTGANRTAMQLACLDRVVLSSDDDTLCRPHGGVADRIRVTSEHDPTQVQLFASLAAAQQAVPPANVSLFLAHEQLLGHNLNDLLATRTPEATTIDDLSGSLIASLVGGRARASVTSSGLLGDSGARYPSFYLRRPEVRDQLRSLPEDDYASLLTSRQIVRLTRSPVLGSGDFFMSTHFAYDGRTFLPPFVPVLRGQDITFARMLRMSTPTQLIGHVPVAVLHQPIDERRVDRAQLAPAGETTAFSYLLEACLRTAASATKGVPPGPPRLAAIGQHLRDLAAQDESVRNDLIRNVVAEATTVSLSRTEELVRALGTTTGAWVEDMQCLMLNERQRLYLARPIASDLAERFGAERARSLMPVMLDEFGQLLESWPAIREAARTLIALETGLFSP